MADRKKISDEKRKEEEERVLAEQEFMRKHMEERRLGKEPPGASRTTSVSSLAESDSEEMEGKKRARGKEESPVKKLKKKREVETEEDEEEEFGDDPVRNVQLGLGMIEKWIRHPTMQLKVTKVQQRKLEEIIGKVKEEVIRCREKIVRIETAIEERGAIGEIVRKTVREELGKGQESKTAGIGSYAAALLAPKVPKVTGVRGPVQPTPKLVIIRHDKKECEEVKATLKRIVKPSEIGLKVKRVTNIRNGVIVEAEDEKGAENLLKHEELLKSGLKVEKPTKKRPVIMIYDVSTDLKDEEIKAEVFEKNLRDTEIEQEEFNKEFLVRHKYKDARSSGKKCHIVVECAVRIRNLLRRKDKIYVEWQSCRVKDYVDVARCFKCQRFGHIAKHCSNEKPACSFCAGEHDFKECRSKGKKEKVCCANCKREGRIDTKHDAGWRGCPVYEKAVKRQNEKIDYGV